MESMAQEMLEHYNLGLEINRLSEAVGRLEHERTRELLGRYLPPPPAVLLDVGGGPGAYAFELASHGYTVHLLDPVQLHIEQALERSSRASSPLESAKIGDARTLSWAEASVDAVLLLGPLYHLTDRRERMIALREAHRVLRRGGVVCAAAISRYASLIDGLRRGHVEDSAFQGILDRDLDTGQHRNPTTNPMYFTTAFFHHPDELGAELREADFQGVEVLAIEGVGWLVPAIEAELESSDRKSRLFSYLRKVEREPSLLGASAHLFGIGRRA